MSSPLGILLSCPGAGGPSSSLSPRPPSARSASSSSPRRSCARSSTSGPSRSGSSSACSGRPCAGRACGPTTAWEPRSPPPPSEGRAPGSSGLCLRRPRPAAREGRGHRHPRHRRPRRLLHHRRPRPRAGRDRPGRPPRADRLRRCALGDHHRPLPPARAVLHDPHRPLHRGDDEAEHPRPRTALGPPRRARRGTARPHRPRPLPGARAHPATSQRRLPCGESDDSARRLPLQPRPRTHRDDLRRPRRRRHRRPTRVRVDGAQ